jgi:hypothetical protein
MLAAMNTFYPDGGPQGHWSEVAPLPDDRWGLRTMYPDASRLADIVASTFKRASSWDSTLMIGLPERAARGSTITVEFTFGNLGTEPAFFDIGFYLSNDSHVTVWDRLIGINRGAYADPGALGTSSRSLTIPADTPPGDYYLGFIVDMNHAIAEGNEDNNTQQYPRRITIY